MLLLKFLIKAAFMRISHSLTPIRPNGNGPMTRWWLQIGVADDNPGPGRDPRPFGCGAFRRQVDAFSSSLGSSRLLRHSPAEMINVIHFTRQWF